MFLFHINVSLPLSFSLNSISISSGEDFKKFKKKKKRALAGVAQWIECGPTNQRVTSSIPSQGTCLGCGPGPQ